MKPPFTYEEFVVNYAPHVCITPKDKYLGFSKTYLVKELVLLSLLADELNVAIIAPPRVGSKSQVCRWLIYIRDYLDVPPAISIDYSSKEHTLPGFYQKLKEMSTPDKRGIIHIDEISKAPPAEQATLLKVLQERIVEIQKVRVRDKFKVYANFIFTANPLSEDGRSVGGGDWLSYGNIEAMRKQLPFKDKALIGRLNLVALLPAYTKEEFAYIINYKAYTETLPKEKRYFLWVDLQKGTIEYNFENFKKYFEWINMVRFKEVKVKIPAVLHNFLLSILEDSDSLVMPPSTVLPEFEKGVIEVAKAIARLLGKNVTDNEVWVRTFDLIIRVLKTQGAKDRILNKLKERHIVYTPEDEMIRKAFPNSY